MGLGFWSGWCEVAVVSAVFRRGEIGENPKKLNMTGVTPK
jgi:hypothetical protein